MKEKITVLIADDNQEFSRTLATYLTNQVIDYLKQFDINDSKTYQKPIIDKNKILNPKDA